MGDTIESYQGLLQNISDLLQKSKAKIINNINQNMLFTYWSIGKHIVEFEQLGSNRAEYGLKLIKNISSDLQNKFKKGFSVRNIEQMRVLYIGFVKPQTLSAKLSRSHYTIILRISNEDARSFYIHQSEINNRSVRELDRQINSMLFERLPNIENKNIFGDNNTDHKSYIPKDIIKDPYILEFLGIPESYIYSENELEQRLIDNLEKFLLELGNGFSFVSRQQRFTIDSDHYYIDLVFYNRFLQCFLLVDLKIGKLTHQDIGQMQMYVNYYDRDIKLVHENKTIGLILCADKKESTVKYTLSENNDQIFASKYQLYMPKNEDLEKFLSEDI